MLKAVQVVSQPSNRGELSRRVSRRRGATMVEFSLFFLIFLLLSYGLMEGARMIWTYTTLSHAARQGARYAMVHGAANPVDDSAIEAVVRKNALGLNPSYLTVTPNWLDASKDRGTVVQVQVQYDFRFVTSLFVSRDSPLPLRSRSRMVVAN